MVLLQIENGDVTWADLSRAVYGNGKNTTTIKRNLGKDAHPETGVYSDTINYDHAVAIARYTGIDPVDVGI